MMNKNFLYGLELCPNDLIVDTITKQRRTHRSKRINKKWLKRYGCLIIKKASNKYYVVGNKVIAHPEYIHKLKEMME